MGIAKIKQLTDASVTCVSRGPGTFPYMAPEMFKESRRGSAVDVYSLGCLYIELFGKKRVWPGLDGPAIMIKVLGSYETLRRDQPLVIFRTVLEIYVQSCVT